MGKLTWPRIRTMLIFDWLWSTVGLILSHGSWAVFDAMFVTLPVVLFLVTVAWPAYTAYVDKRVDRFMPVPSVSRNVRKVGTVLPEVMPAPSRRLVDWRVVARLELEVYGITKFHLDSPA